MDPLAVALVLTSAAIHALRDLLTKKSADRQIFIFLFISLSSVLFLPIYLWYISTRAFPWEWFPFMLLASFVHTAYAFAIARAYDHGDLSHVYPIIRSAPAIVMVLAIVFLGEYVSVAGIVGIALVVAGAYLINAKGWSLARIFEPIWSICTERATQFALLTMCTVCLYSLMDRVIVVNVDPWIYLYVMTILIAVFMAPFIVLTKTWAQIVHVWKTDTVAIVANNFIAFISYGCILFALQFAKVSYVTGLRQISVVLAVLLGGHILREDHKSERLLAAMLIFTGALFISVEK